MWHWDREIKPRRAYLAFVMVIVSLVHNVSFVGPETDTFCQFLGPEIVKTGQYSLWPPETDVMGQFLGPETDIMDKRYFMC